MAQWALYLLIFGPAGGAAAFVTLRWLLPTAGPCTLSSRLGPANWDFSKSWASNITVVGALLGTILSAGVLPDATTVSKATYAGLNLFFGVLILIAPLVYTSTQNAVLVHRRSPEKEAQYQGYVVAFLVSSAITLWAVVGELVTVLLLFREIRTGNSIPEAAVWVMGAIVVVACALISLYAWRTIDAVITDECELRDARRARKVALHRELLRTCETPETVPGAHELQPARAAWALL
jgi:heme/copper-type cytochrome/quinol oxidase subunit 2